ncbi:MAG: Ig-like domain-containing protein, partial [Pyrinomonadaceae bacterium]
MNHRTSILRRRALRAYAAAFISYLMLAGQVAPLALGAAAPRAARPRPAAETAATTTTSPVKDAAPLAAAPMPAPLPFFAPVITATKVDSWDDTATPDGKAEPGQVVTYTVTITNSGPDPATGVQFSDAGDPNTSLVPGSVQTQPVAAADTASAFGNVKISTASGAPNLLANDCDPDDTTGPCNDNLTASGPTTSTNNGNVVVNADGTFEYNPAPGFTGSDTFTYTVRDKGPDGTANNADDKTDTAVMTITVGPTLIWFINNDPGAPAGNDGRITSPFNSIASYNASAPAKDPNDIVFIYQTPTAYAGSLTLTSGMKLIGQGFTLENETGAEPAGSEQLPGATANPVINSAAGNTVTLNQNNTIRGLTLNNSAAIDIFGNAFGTLTVSNVTLSGTGRALSLTTGTLAATFDSITSTSASGGQGIILSAVGGSMASTGGTSITGATTQGILVTGSTVSANFGNTTISGGTDAVSMQNNSSGTRTFGTLTISGNSAVGFLHGAGGGTTTVTGATSITNPGGNGIDIQNSNAAVTFAATTVGKNNAGTNVNLSNNGANATSFSSLAITASSGAGLVTSAGGNLTISTGSLTTTGTGVAASLTNTTLDVTFTTVSSNGGANGLIFSGGSGSFTSGTTNLQNNAGIGLLMSSSAVAANFGNTTVNSSAGDAVDLSSNTAAITFADLDLTPDAGLRGLDAQNNTQAITATSGDITTSGGGTASAVFIDGPAARTPINLTFTSVTTSGVGSGSASVSIIDASGTKFQVTGTTQINTRSGRGVFVDNTTATTVQFATVNIPNPSNAGGNAFHVEDSSSAVTVATVAISDPFVTTAQTDGSDGFADTDGDGDGIFLRGNSGLFTLNGGTISNPGNDGIDARASRIAITGVTITNPGQDMTGGTGEGAGGNGIYAMNLTGASTIATTTISGFNVANRSGIVINSNVGPAASLAVTGSTFQNATGNTGLTSLITGTGIFTLTVGGATNNASTNCTFTNISASAMVIRSAGTGALNATVQNSTFQNAPLNGKTNLTGGATDGATGNFTIINNTFNNVFKTASTGESVISFVGGLTGVPGTPSFGANISGNTISNVGLGNSTCGGGATYCGGPLQAILVFIDGGADTNGTLNINNNVITNVQQGGILLDMANDAGGIVDAKITGNTIGTDAAPVGVGGTNVTNQFGITVFRRRVGAEAANVLISNNSIRNGSGAANTLTGAGIFVRGQADTTMSTTITSNNINTLSTGPSEIRVDANSPGVGEPDSATVCADINGNTVGGAAGAIDLNEQSTNTLNIEQASAAAVAAANGGATVTADAGVAFGVTCATPPAGPLGGGGSDDFLSVFVVAPIATTTGEEKPKSAFGGGVTDRPFIGMPRTAPKPAEQKLVAPTTGNVRKATSTATATAAAAGTQQSNAGTPTTATATAEQTAPVTTRGGVDKRAPRALVQSDDPGGPNGTGVGISGLNIGTLAPGDSVTITFQVTIDNPYSGGPNVLNQGTVTVTQGTAPTNDDIVVLTDDPSAGGAADPTLTPVNANKIHINNAKVAEPASPNTVDMTFTVSLATPATGAITVNFATANQTATAGTCGNPGADYVSTSGQVAFATGEQVKTINVPVCSDSDSEGDETFVVNLTGPAGAGLDNTQGVGTITLNTPGTFLISELRTSGPGGSADDFVELYNNSDTPLTVAATDISAGFGVFKMGADCNATPVLLGTIPNGTVIPARGHYLMVGSAYSLANYGGTGAAAGNLTMTSDIEDNRNVGVFSTDNVAAISTSNRLDAVGFGTNTGGACNLLREPSNLPAGPLAAALLDYTFFRKQCDFVTGVGCTAGGNPKDGNDNSTDFLFADTMGSTVSGVPQRLGAPGPENMASPIRRDTTGVFATLLDSTKPSSAEPNRHRDLTDTGTNKSFGSLSIRRRVTNTTGGNVTRLRFRIVEMTTFPNTGPGEADMRALTSGSVSVMSINDPGTCGASPTPCTLTIEGTTLETPPAQTEGGGYNST